VDGWAGVFRPLCHLVSGGARRLQLGVEWVYFAECGSPCWPPDRVSADGLWWCAKCWQVGQTASEGQRTVMTTESSSACQE
jgi:hypothetical protein